MDSQIKKQQQSNLQPIKREGRNKQTVYLYELISNEKEQQSTNAIIWMIL